MEVHAHTHTPRKKWTHYLWEFLMLFLAVTAGFFVENQREIKYVQSLIQDLKTDTSNLRGYMFQKQIKKKRIDSLMLLLTTGMYNQSGNDTYFFARILTRGQQFVSTDGTMQQLKNAGNLRLITKRNVVDSILAYDRNLKLLQKQDENEEYSRNRFQNAVHNVFNASVLYQMIDSVNFITKPTNNPQTLTNDKNLINNIALEVHYLGSGVYYSYFQSARLITEAATLVELLKKEYDLE